MQNKKAKIKRIVIMAVSLITGCFIGGFIAAALLKDGAEHFSFWEYMLCLFGYFAILCVAYFLHIVAHEGGHLIFGLLTGYKFISFRIGSVMLIKENGKLKLKKFSLAGTGGQCLLLPPELKNGKMPYVLYNLGGVIVNGAIAAVCLLLYFVLPDIHIISVALMMLALVGFAVAAMNGIPMQTGLISNDGHNALSLGKDADALRSFYCQLKVNGLIAQGKRLRDISDELFALRDGADTANPINNTIKVFACNKLMDEHKFSEAAAEILIIKQNPNVIGIYENMLTCDLLFCKLILGEAVDAEGLLGKAQRNFMAAMAKNPSIIRTWYAYCLLYEKDAVKAERYKKDFENVAVSSPYKCDIESERELMAIAENTAKESSL